MSEATMSWSKVSVSGDVEHAGRLVRDAVQARRRAGQKNEMAIAEAADALGLSERRARGLLYGEVFKLAAEEFRRLRYRWQADVDKQTADLIAYAIRREKEAEQTCLAGEQLLLPFGPSSTSPGSSSASGSGGGPR